MSAEHRYTEPGRYFAVCNKANFDGHYCRFFDLPSEEEREEEGCPRNCDAAWYFMNRLDLVACVVAVYPASCLFSESERGMIRVGLSAAAAISRTAGHAGQADAYSKLAENFPSD